MKILVVDDDKTFANCVAALLAEMGHEQATVATDCEAAIAEVKEQDFRVVISDWVMPEMSGLDLCRELRKPVEDPYRYFILLTGKKGLQHRREAIEAGIDDFLTKPVDEDELLGRLHVAERILGYMARIEGLESLLPVCCYCKKVQSDDSTWQDVSYYLREERGTKLSHGICPECMKTHVEDIYPEGK